MGKGYDKNQERKELLNNFGRQLVRRSKSCCELCGEGDQKLEVFELEPESRKPEFERVYFICETCKSELSKKVVSNSYWRFLSETVWSEIPVIQAQAVLILRRLSEKEQWASDLLEQIYLTDGVEELLG